MTNINLGFLSCVAVAGLLGSLPCAGQSNPFPPPPTPTSPTSTTITAPASSYPFNSSINISASVAAASIPTGKVFFFDGVKLAGVSTLSGTSASLFWKPLTAGVHSVRAFYGGDSSNSPSYSAVSYITIQGAASGAFAFDETGFSSATPAYPTIGDFNNDGISDVAAIEQNGKVLLMLGDGAGNYSTSEPITGIGTPNGLVAGDFNGDGKLDLAVTDSSNHVVFVYLGNGDGTFNGEPSLTTSGAGSQIATGDFNGDGYLDLAVIDNNVGINVFLNNGDGTFATETALMLTGNLTGLVAGDFNGDGIADLAVSNGSANAVSTFLGSLSGLSASATISVGSAFGIVAADFNGDHVLDLAVLDNTNMAILVLTGNPNGTFGTPAQAGALLNLAFGLAAGDLDGDNAPDLVAFGLDSQTLLLNRGLGTFYSPLSTSGGGAINGLVLGSLDNSGRTGLVATSFDVGVEIAYGAPYPLVAISGDQSSAADMVTAAPLQAQLQDFGHPANVSGVAVTFTAPEQGPGGYFAGLGRSVTVNTDSTGTATAPAFVTNSAVGSYQVQAGALNQNTTFSLVNEAPVNGPSACTYTVSLETLVFNSAGGSNVFTVSPNLPLCQWSVTADSSWITVSQQDFTGAGTITVSVMPNLSGSPKKGNVLVAGQYMSVLQWPTTPTVVDAPSGVSGSAVTEMVGYGFSAGCSAAPLDYCPNLPITRAQAAVMLVRGVYGSDNFAYSTTPHFSDVNASSFGFAWIQKLYELGITAGCGNGNFCPGENLPRDQASVLLVRSRLGGQTVYDFPSTPYFTDVPASSFAFKAVQRLRLENITAGCGANSFCPSEPVTRGQMAVFIMRALTNQFLPVATPLITEVSNPSRGVRSLLVDGSFTLTITGENTHFDSETSSIFVAGANTVTDFTVYSPTYATATISGTNATALDTPESVIVTTGSEEAVIPNAISFEAPLN